MKVSEMKLGDLLELKGQIDLELGKRVEVRFKDLDEGEYFYDAIGARWQKVGADAAVADGYEAGNFWGENGRRAHKLTGRGAPPEIMKPADPAPVQRLVLRLCAIGETP